MICEGCHQPYGWHGAVDGTCPIVENENVEVTKKFQEAEMNHRPTVEVKVDMVAIEERILASLTPSTTAVDLALKLPKHHPLRFALLYSAGPKTLERMAAYQLEQLSIEKLRCQYSEAEPGLTNLLEQIRLEAQIEVFENWQTGAADDALTRRRRENAAIAYAAAEVGIRTRPAFEAPPEVTCGPTGRLSKGGGPDIQCNDRHGRDMGLKAQQRWIPRRAQWLDGAATGRWTPGEPHPYPEDGILRD
jgi:hypothetical protein